MSTFWSGWIIVLTALNIVGCWWLIRWTMKKRAGESAEGDVTGHTWDDNLEEYNNPLPRWWLWLFYITLVFAVVYLVLYPGMGTWKGVLGWSSGNTLGADDKSMFVKEQTAAAEKYGPIYRQYAAVAIADLATGAEYQDARDMGKRLYLTYCMQCHGSDAGGSRGFPNLTDDDWLYGGSPEAILASIANGRNGIMPAFAHLDEATTGQLAQFVLSLTGRSTDAAGAEAGKAAFIANGCAGCHGADGKGNQLIGAPNLTDDYWLYGGSKSMIVKTIQGGRNGVMPAHQKLLGDDKVHILAAYAYSLSKN